MHFRKKNNRGITLVELIVTIAILAIIVLPLLRAFVISAQTNAKAKEKLRTTELAQNIMEGITASDLEYIAYQFNYPGSDNKDFKLVSGQNAMEVQELVATDDGSFAPVTKADGIEIPDFITNPEDILGSFHITSSIIHNSGAANATFVGQPSGTYYFAMKNLVAGGDNASETSAKSYDALVTLTANNDEISDGTDSVLNQNELVSLNNIDARHDALSIASEKPSEIMNLIEGNGHVSVQQSDIRRDITITVEEVPGVSDTYTRVTVEYQYKWMEDGREVVYPANSTEGDYTEIIFENNGETERDLSNVYLFYYPWYSSTQSNQTDFITIDNQADRDVSVYLIKQNNGDVNLESLENNYRVNVNVKEPWEVSDTITDTIIRSNLDTNLFTDNDTTGEQAIWALNGVAAGAASQIANDELAAKEITDRLFNITVTIYPAGSYDNNFQDAEAIASLTGGMAN